MGQTAFIFARGGSKGIIGKNTKIFFGKPLIYWAINQALCSTMIERVIVSTDCKKIADIAIECGAEVPFLRPSTLSQDNSPEWKAWQHALNYLNEKEGRLPELFISVPCTSPLRHTQDIERCLEEFQIFKPDILVTTTKSNRSPFFNMIFKNKDGTIRRVCEPDVSIHRRQDCPEVFNMTTVCYVADPKFILSNESIFSGTVRCLDIPEERAIDIDTPLDFEIAEFIAKKAFNI